MPADAVVSSYHDLWYVEQSFRMSKTDFAARPMFVRTMFVRTKDAIEAHLTTVFAALAVSQTVQNRSRPSIRNVCRQRPPLRSATIAINGVVETLPPEVPPQQLAVIADVTQP